jgi:hypothetical protein
MTDQTSPSATGEVQTIVAPPPERKSRAQIAKELFGNEYKGEVPAEPKPAETTEEPEPVNTEAGEEPPLIEEPAEGEEPTEGDETASEETGETPIATLSELAEHFELDPDYVQTLKVPVYVDGTPTEATIGDLIKSYQLGEAADHRLELAKAYQAKQGEAWAAKHQELEQNFQVLAEMIKLEDANLERDMKAIDPKLRDEDPAEWAARIQEFTQRRAQIAQMKNATVEKYKVVADQRARESEEIKNQFMAEEHKVLLQKLPEWQDQKRADAEKAEIANYLVQSGFQPQELSNLIDHRQVVIARKAMLYDKSRGQVDTAKKRVATVPKIMKSGAPKPAEQRASERLMALKAKLAKTGTVEDAVAYRLAKRGVR